ncbi:MAG: Mrp/NBP35 family ATP-binding protein [Chloroflexi bacterium]|nr:Mrp/NBP35 family ATP-binding protein [Chloroflexota bacterium]
MAEAPTLEDKIMAELSTVIEPELHRDLVTLEMIHSLSVTDSAAEFTIRLTTPACPLKHQMEAEATEAVLRVPGIESVKVNFDAQVTGNPRNMGRMSVPIKNLIAVSSGKGGVGKSTVSVNLAIALAQTGATVGLMDADITGPNIPTMLGIDQMPPASNNKLVPAEIHGLKVISMGFLADPGKPLVWRGPMIHGAIRQFFSDVAWGELDYMVIDLPPGTGDAQLSLAQSTPLTGAVIVTQPQDVAVGDAVRGLAMFETVNVPIIGVIENMSGEFFGEGGGQKMAEARGVPFLGSVPLDPQVRIGGDSGEPIVANQPDSPAAEAFQHIAQQVAARISVINFEADDNVIPLNLIG